MTSDPIRQDKLKEMHDLWRTVVDRIRTARSAKLNVDAARAEYEAALAELEREYGCAPGHTIDVFGDGGHVPRESATPNPDV